MKRDVFIGKKATLVAIESETDETPFCIDFNLKCCRILCTEHGKSPHLHVISTKMAEKRKINIQKEFDLHTRL